MPAFNVNSLGHTWESKHSVFLLYKIERTHLDNSHSPQEIISTMGKTGQDAWRKWKPCRKVFIHISNKSASNKLKNVSLKYSKLLCLNRILFCSKCCKLKTSPLSIGSVLTLIVNRPRQCRPLSNRNIDQC